MNPGIQVKAAVNAPHSRRFALFNDALLSRSVWTAVTSAPLLGLLLTSNPRSQ
jgi:hypothetical protein